MVCLAHALLYAPLSKHLNIIETNITISIQLYQK